MNNSGNFKYRIFIEMVRATYRKRGSGYLMPSEYFNPNARQPSAPNSSTISAAPIQGWVRQPISATNVISPAGGKRSTRRARGGFAPALMGAFAANAQTAIVPLALLGLYSAFGVKRTQAPNLTKKGNVAKKVSSSNAK